MGVGWLAFLIIWLFFFATDYSFWKNIGVIFASIVIAITLIATIWIGYGMRMGQMYAPDAPEWRSYRSIRWRGVANVLVMLAWAVFFIVWLTVYADDYSGYQNLAVILVSVLVAGGISAALWSSMRRFY